MNTAGKPRFVLIGAAGYIAPRHLKAIRDVGGELVAALDPNDSVGIMDAFFPEAAFFKSLEELDGFVEAENRAGRKIDYVAVCSPNNVHAAHIRFGLNRGADVICEKPLVLDIETLEALAETERRTARSVNSVLQLRLHPSIIALRDRVAASDARRSVDLTYVTSRGRWYFASWKGDVERSGGVAMNIGIHFFDMLGFVFGEVEESVAHVREANRCAGFLRLAKADVRWFLSVERDDLPASAVAAGKTTYRAIDVDGAEVEFSDGFTELHTETYRAVLEGRGYGLDDVRPSIALVSDFRRRPLSTQGEMHPLAAKFSGRS